MTITLLENFRALFYAPFYAAHALGAYAAEGIDVRLKASPSPATTLDALLKDEADVVWGGPLRVLSVHDRDPRSDLVCFCEVVTRDPFFLIGRTPNQHFTFADLQDLRLAVVSEVPTPWICFQEDLCDAAVDPESLDVSNDRSMADNAVALRAGMVDVVQVFQPYAESLIREGVGHIWHAAASRGHTAYTSFYTKRATIERKRDEIAAMTRAVYRLQKWLHRNDGAAVARAVRDYFPDVAPDLLAACIDRYKALGLYGRDPLLSREGFERLRRAMLGSEFIARATPFEVCVDNAPAEAAIATDPPAL